MCTLLLRVNPQTLNTQGVMSLMVLGMVTCVKCGSETHSKAKVCQGCVSLTLEFRIRELKELRRFEVEGVC